MADERLIVRMDGLSEDGGAILGRHFMGVISNTLALLKQADKEQAAGEKGPKSDFFVVDASHNSPYQVEIACQLQGGDRSSYPAINSPVLAVDNAFRNIQKGKADNISAPMMAKIEKLIDPCRAKASHRLKFLEIGFVNGRDNTPLVPIDSSFIDQVHQSRAREFACHTVVSGPAEMLDLRKKKKGGKIQMKVLRLGGEVTCILDSNLHERAINAMGKVAVVRGLGHYRPNAFHPYQIEVTNDNDIDILDLNSGAPKLSELEGAFPGLTGGKSVAEYLREIRGDE